jgi:hypothetical protein
VHKSWPDCRSELAYIFGKFGIKQKTHRFKAATLYARVVVGNRRKEMLVEPGVEINSIVLLLAVEYQIKKSKHKSKGIKSKDTE